jgi:flagellar hook-associated protein 2
MTMSLSTGLISGMDTGALVSQLIAAEAAPQTALKARLKSAENAASAYRTVNTTFAAVRAAAEAFTTSSITSTRTAASTNTNVTASATASATKGSKVTFTVTALASTQTLASVETWTAPTDDVRAKQPNWPITIYDSKNVALGTVSLPAAPPATSLADAAKAINTANLGVSAAVLKTAGGYKLQLTSATGGAAGAVRVVGQGEDPMTGGAHFLTTSPGQDATLDLGGGQTATSGSNTFADLITGVSVTVSKADATQTTVTVGSDSAGAASKMQTLVDAVNSALTTVKTYSSNAKGSTAALKGDFSLTSLSGELLQAVSIAVGADGSPAKVGIQLTKDGKVTFDKAKFAAALEATPELAQRMVGGTPAVAGPPAVAAVPGIATRLFDVAKSASDSATGSLVKLAEGRESTFKGIQERIDAWDLRLAKRKETLNRQFTAMETSLSSLRNQSTWLAGQINSLPSG